MRKRDNLQEEAVEVDVLQEGEEVQGEVEEGEHQILQGLLSPEE